MSATEEFVLRFRESSAPEGSDGVYRVSFDLTGPDGREIPVDVALPRSEGDGLTEAEGATGVDPGQRQQRLFQAMAASGADLINAQTLGGPIEGEALALEPDPIQMRTLLLEQPGDPLPELQSGQEYRRWAPG